MGTAMLSLLPLIISAAAMPLWIILTLLLLRSEGGLIKAATFATGALTVRVMQGVLFGYLFRAVPEEGNANTEDLIASTLLLVMGVVMLIAAVRAWCKEIDPDAPPPTWMATVGAVSAFKAFGMGALLTVVATKQWVFTLSAIAVIYEADLSPSASVLAYLCFILAAQSLVLAPIVGSAIAPAQSAKVLETANAWLERNNRAITMTASLIFGVWFVGKGTTGLLHHSGTAIT